MCSPGVTERLGGVQVIRSGNAFTDVQLLMRESVVVQATEYMREYGAERVRTVFDVLCWSCRQICRFVTLEEN